MRLYTCKPNSTFWCSCSARVTSRLYMATLPENGPQWWDREVDDLGAPIRTEVRSAAHDLWPSFCTRVRSVLGDMADAAELMEAAVVHISHHLDRNSVPPSFPEARSLLMLHFHQELRRRAGKLGRIKPVGATAEIEEYLSVPNWIEEVNRRMDFDKLRPHLSKESCIIFGMRVIGHGWREIGEILGTSPASARSSFWRDIREAQLAISQKNEHPKKGNAAGDK